MREPGTSFEFKGITLHVVKAISNTTDSCFGCHGYSELLSDWTDDCRALGNSSEGLSTCGFIDNGVVFVEDVNAFKLASVTKVLTK